MIIIYSISEFTSHTRQKWTFYIFTALRSGICLLRARIIYVMTKLVKKKKEMKKEKKTLGTKIGLVQNEFTVGKLLISSF